MKDHLYKTNFKFVTSYYEVWESGECISKGKISTEIIAKVSGNKIYFDLGNIGNIRMQNYFYFNILEEQFSHSLDRILYKNLAVNNPNIPFACSLMYSGDVIRFTMEERLVEFYGNYVNIWN